jgi:hypothetical protein
MREGILTMLAAKIPVAQNIKWRETLSVSGP